MNAHRVSRLGRLGRRVPVARFSRANDADDDADDDDDAALATSLATSLARDATRVVVDATARVIVGVFHRRRVRARGRSTEPFRAHTHTHTHTPTDHHSSMTRLQYTSTLERYETVRVRVYVDIYYMSLVLVL